MQTNAISTASWLVSKQPEKLPKNWGGISLLSQNLRHEGSLQKGLTHANAIYVR